MVHFPRRGWSLCVLLVSLGGAARGGSPHIAVTPADDLRAVVEGNPGSSIVLAPGDYWLTATLDVPDGTTLEGAGRMTFGADGPAGFAPGSQARLLAAATLVGDVVTLGDGAALRGLTVEDWPGRFGGSVVVVGSRRVGDAVEAAIDACEIVTPNGSSVTPNGPGGRAVMLLSRRLRRPPEPAFGDSMIGATITRSIIRSPGGGTGIFAINFAPRSAVTVRVNDSVIGGGLDADGGVSRPDLVTDSSVTIESTHNLWRPDGAGDGSLGMYVHGGSGPPVPFIVVGSTAHNTLSLSSVSDRIEGFTTAVVAVGGERWFGPPSAQPTNDCRINLSMQGAKLSGNQMNVALYGAIVDDVGLTPGDGNTLHVFFRGVHAEGAVLPNDYADAIGPLGPLPPELAGTGNRVSFFGTATAFANSNSIGNQPDASAFDGASDH